MKTSFFVTGQTGLALLILFSGTASGVGADADIACIEPGCNNISSWTEGEEGLDLLQMKSLSKTVAKAEQAETPDIEGQAALQEQQRVEVDVNEEVAEEQQSDNEANGPLPKTSCKCPKCTSGCKHVTKCYCATKVVECPGFGGSKWKIMVKAESYVESYGRWKAYVVPKGSYGRESLANVVCYPWGRSGKDAYKFRLESYLTREFPDAVNPKTKKYKDVNIKKSDICKCSANKKCVGRTSQIFVKVNIKNGAVTCWKDPSKKEKDVLGTDGLAKSKPKPKPKPRPRPAPKPAPKPAPAPGPAPAGVPYTEVGANCNCASSRVSTHRSGKETVDKCGAACKAKSNCKSFGLWAGGKASGLCVLFDKACAGGDGWKDGSKACDKPTGSDYPNKVFNMLDGFLDSGSNCNCGKSRLSTMSSGKETVDKCAAECKKNGKCKSFALWAGGKASGLCVLFDKACKGGDGWKDGKKACDKPTGTAYPNKVFNKV